MVHPVRVTPELMSYLDSDSCYDDSLGRLLLVIIPTNDYHCVG